ncbi:MAG: PilZ domain-containing protein [Deltaproteobacteria bacterium]|nr:PilZ domain-containing protein [Deltaproteobacteria bacterium]
MNVSDRHPTNLWAAIDPATVHELAEALAVPSALLVERRNRDRHRVAVPIEVFVPGERHPRRRLLRDVSHDGLSFASTHPMRPGTTISIRIRDQAPPLHLTARIAWSQLAEGEWEIGAYFVGGDDGAHNRFVAVVCELSLAGHTAARPRRPIAES